MIAIFIQQDRRLEPRANAIAFALVAAVRSATQEICSLPIFLHPLGPSRRMSPAAARGQHAAKCHIGFCERYVLSDYGTTTKIQWHVWTASAWQGAV